MPKSIYSKESILGELASPGYDESASDTTLALQPDTALCEHCLEELFDQKNRRYHYPFLHCSCCGPSFSLDASIGEFEMCEECQKEYSDPEDRRFQLQSNCCPQCGPQLETGIEMAADALLEGKIVAMKNTGGYLLLVDATNADAVQRLREKKQQLAKPFALLVPSSEAAAEIAEVGAIEKELLCSPAAPIVLLKKRKSRKIASVVAHESPYHGVMLPHNAMQHMLLRLLKRPLAITSGKLSGRPLCISAEEAEAMLGEVADLFLHHNLKIQHRLNDSIVQVIGGKPVMIRKGRGYTPSVLDFPSSKSIFAAGSQIKNSFAYLKQGHIYLSQQMGGLSSAETCQAYEAEVKNWDRLLDVHYAEGVGDKHPDYYSTRYVLKKNISSTRIQHHQAHVWSCAVDNQLEPPFFSLVWDGTGYGDDGTLWGGEAFLVEGHGMKRICSLYPFLLPGGERVVGEPRRSMIGLYQVLGQSYHGEAFREEERLNIQLAMKKKLHSPLCSSMGRLFDGVAAILNLCQISDYEAQAALLLESAALKSKKSPQYEIPIIKEKNLHLFDWRPMIRKIIHQPNADAALGFHKALAQAMVALANIGGQERVLLTGSVMQNRLLVELAIDELTKAGFKPVLHHNIPPNDGGIAVGQLIGSHGLIT